jgi:hypothetical protein
MNITQEIASNLNCAVAYCVGASQSNLKFSAAAALRCKS